MWTCFVKGYISFYSTTELRLRLTVCGSKSINLFTSKGESSICARASVSISSMFQCVFLADEYTNCMGDKGPSSEKNKKKVNRIEKDCLSLLAVTEGDVVSKMQLLGGLV